MVCDNKFWIFLGTAIVAFYLTFSANVLPNNFKYINFIWNISLWSDVILADDHEHEVRDIQGNRNVCVRWSKPQTSALQNLG